MFFNEVSGYATHCSLAVLIKHPHEGSEGNIVVYVSQLTTKKDVEKKEPILFELPYRFKHPDVKQQDERVAFINSFRPPFYDYETKKDDENKIGQGMMTSRFIGNLILSPDYCGAYIPSSDDNTP